MVHVIKTESYHKSSITRKIDDFKVFKISISIILQVILVAVIFCNIQKIDSIFLKKQNLSKYKALNDAANNTSVVTNYSLNLIVFNKTFFLSFLILKVARENKSRGLSLFLFFVLCFNNFVKMHFSIEHRFSG